MPAFWLSQPSPAGRARRQVSFLSEAIIEKRRSSANLVHQVLVSSFDSKETTGVVTRSWLKPSHHQCWYSTKSAAIDGKCFDLQKAVTQSRTFAEVEQIKVHPRTGELTIVAVELQMPLAKGNIGVRRNVRNSKTRLGVPRNSSRASNPSPWHLGELSKRGSTVQDVN